MPFGVFVGCGVKIVFLQLHRLTLIQQIRVVRAESFNAADDAEFRMRGSVLNSELTALYQHDEIRVAMKLKLPLAYPLQAVVVTFSEKSGVEENQYVCWFMFAYYIYMCAFIFATFCVIGAFFVNYAYRAIAR